MAALGFSNLTSDHLARVCDLGAVALGKRAAWKIDVGDQTYRYRFRSERQGLYRDRIGRGGRLSRWRAGCSLSFVQNNVRRYGDHPRARIARLSPHGHAA